MNLEAHSSLWSSIQQFPLDDPDAAINFSRKLAAQQHWSEAFTQKAITEYRKFIFLCCIAPRGASPSKVVDEVWHLHLTYTQSYWVDFCKNTLGKDIHHNPSKGGNKENHQHEQWYHETLQLYESVFGSPPPAEIWPPPKHEPPQIPKQGRQLKNETKALIILVLLLPFLLIGLLFQRFNPFLLKGHQFLVYFPLLVLSMVICFVLWQHEKRSRLIDLVIESYPADATVFQLSQFFYGKHRAIQTAIVDLVRRDLLRVQKDKSFTVHKNGGPIPGKEQNPLIPGFLEETAPYVTYQVIAANWYNERSAVHPSLEYLYQLAYTKEKFVKRFNFLLVPIIMALMRTVQGIGSGYPVGYLVLEVVGYVIIALVLENRFYVKSVVFRKMKELCKMHQGQKLLHNDELVSDYALRGKIAVSNYSEGFIMALIFSAYPAINHHYAMRNKGEGFISTCSGCNGGGSGGDSGGGSCGSGGCGGCGGGGGD